MTLGYNTPLTVVQRIRETETEPKRIDSLHSRCESLERPGKVEILKTLGYEESGGGGRSGQTRKCFPLPLYIPSELLDTEISLLESRQVV